MKRRVWMMIGLCLAICLAVSVFGGIALAEENEITATDEVEIYPRFRVDPEDAEDAFIREQFGLPVTPVDELPRMRGTVGGDLLGDEETPEKRLYNALKGKALQVAAGTLSLTQFSFTTQQFPDLVFNAAELDMAGENLWENGAFRDITRERISERVSGIVSKAFNAVLYDCPYEMFWINRGPGGGYRTSYSFSGSVVEGVQTVRIYNLYVNIIVNASYVDQNATPTGYMVDSDKIQSVTAAANYAQSIVTQAINAGGSDDDKLAAYKSEICSLTDYNTAAADPDWEEGYGDPWQLIYVFDRNSATKVVCEGYSKAFMYLCDQTEEKHGWTGNVSTICVSGMMYTWENGVLDGGPHMWNVVTKNGVSALADVTNSDTGSIGADGGLFMSGYKAKDDQNRTYVYATAGGDVIYAYDTGTIHTLSGSEMLATAAGTTAESLMTLTCDKEADGQGIISMPVHDKINFTICADESIRGKIMDARIVINDETERLNPWELNNRGETGFDYTPNDDESAENDYTVFAQVLIPIDGVDTWVNSKPLTFTAVRDGEITEDVTFSLPDYPNWNGGSITVPQDGILAVNVDNIEAEYYGAFVTQNNQVLIADSHWVEKEWVPGVTLVHVPMNQCTPGEDYEIHVYAIKIGAQQKNAETVIPVHVSAATQTGAILVNMSSSYVVSAPVCFYARYTGALPAGEPWLRLRVFEAEKYCPLEERFDPGDNWYDESGDPNDFWETNLRIGRPGNYVLEAALWKNVNGEDQILEDTVVTKPFTLTKTGNLEAPVFVSLPKTVRASQLADFSFSFTTKFPQHISVIISKEGWEEAAYFGEASFWYDGENEDYNDPDKADQYLAATWGMPGLSYESDTTGTEGNMKNGKVVCRPGFQNGMDYGEYQIFIIADRWNYETSSQYGTFMVVPDQEGLIITEPEAPTGRTAQEPAEMCDGFHAIAYSQEAETIFFYVNDTIYQARPGAVGEYSGMLTDETTVIHAEAVKADGTKTVIGRATLYAQGEALGNKITLPTIPDTLPAGQDWSITLSRPNVGDKWVAFEAKMNDLTREWWNSRIQITDNDSDWGPLNGNVTLSVDGDELIAGHTYELKLNIFATGYEPIYITKKITAVAAGKTHDPILLSAAKTEYDENTHSLTKTQISSPATLPLHTPVLFRFKAPGASMVRFWRGEGYDYLTKWDTDEDGWYEIDWDYWVTGTVQLFAQACYEDIPNGDERWYNPEQAIWEPVTEAEVFTIELYEDGMAPDMTVTIGGLTADTIMQGDWLTVSLTGADNSAYSICAASIYQYEDQRIRVDMEYDFDQGKYSCRIPTAMLEPGQYHMVVFAEAVGKANRDKHFSFTVTENESITEGDAFLLTTTAQKGSDGVYTAEAYEDIEICYWAPYWEGHEKYYKFNDGHGWWDWEDRDDFGSTRIELEPGEWTIKAQVHYINEATEEEDGFIERELHFRVSGAGMDSGIGLDIDWVYDLSKVNLTQTDGWLPLFQLSTAQGKDPKWWRIRAEKMSDDMPPREILSSYSDWGMDSLLTDRAYAVKQSEENIQPGDRMKVNIEIHVQGCEPFRAEGTMTFVSGTDSHIALKVNGKSDETSVQTRTEVPIEITISGNQNERPTELRYRTGKEDGRWCYVGCNPENDTVRITERFDSGDWAVCVQGLYETGEGQEPEWSESVSNTVLVHATASETAKRAAYTVTPTTLNRGGLVTVNVTGTDPEAEATEKEPTFFSIRFRKDGREEDGVFLETTIPFTAQIPTSRLEAGEWYVCVDTSAANCEWNVEENGTKITVTEPANDELILAVPETIYAQKGFSVSAYAKGADKIVIHYLKAGDDGEDPEDFPDTYWNEYAFENEQRLNEGEYTIWAVAEYPNGTTKATSQLIRTVGYVGTVPITLNGPTGGAFNAAQGLTFTVEGLTGEHVSNWNVNIWGNESGRIAEWRAGDEGPVTNQQGVTTFTVSKDKITVGETIYINAEAWGKPGWRNNRRETKALAIQNTQGTLSLSQSIVMRPAEVTATATGLPNDATYAMLLMDNGRQNLAKVNAQHKATWTFTEDQEGVFTCWARYTTDDTIHVDEHDLWNYNWNAVEWDGGTNAVTLTVTAPYGQLTAPDFTIRNNRTTVTRGEFFTVDIGQLKTLEDPDAKEWYIGSLDWEDGRRGRDCQWDAATKTILVPTGEYQAGNYMLRVYVDAVGYRGNEILTPVTITEPANGQMVASVNGVTSTTGVIDVATLAEIRWSVYAPGATEISATMNRGAEDNNPMRQGPWSGECADNRFYAWGDAGTAYVTITAEYPSGSDETKTWQIRINAAEGTLNEPTIEADHVIKLGEDLEIGLTAKGGKKAGGAADQNVVPDNIHISLTNVSGPQGWYVSDGEIEPDGNGEGSYTFSGDMLQNEGMYEINADSNKPGWNSGHARKRVTVVKDTVDKTKTVSLTIDGRSDAQMTYPSSQLMHVEASATGATAIRVMNGNRWEYREGDSFEDDWNYGDDTIIVAMACYDAIDPNLNWEELSWTGLSNVIEVKITNEGSLGEPNIGAISSSYTRGQTLTVTIGSDPAAEAGQTVPEVWYYAEAERQETDGDGNHYWNHRSEWHWDWTGTADRKINISTFPMEPGTYRLRVCIDTVGWEGNEVIAGPFEIVNPDGFITDIPDEIPVNCERDYYALIPGAKQIRQHILKKNDQNAYEEYWGWTGWSYIDCTCVRLNFVETGNYRIQLEAADENGTITDTETKDFTVTGGPLSGEIRITMEAPWTSGALKFSIVTTDPDVQFSTNIHEEKENGKNWYYGNRRNIEIDGSQLSDDCDYWINVEQWKEGYLRDYRSYRIRRIAANETLKLPAGLTTLESEAFRGINARMVIIPYGVTRLEENTFADCPNLAAAVIPDSVTEIDPYTFGYNWDMTIYGSSNTAKTFAESKGYGYIELTGE